MVRITEIVKHLLIINVIVFLISQVLINMNMGHIVEQYFVLYPMDTNYFKPIQLVTNMFSHANFRHILFNMLVLFFLGPMVEMSLGPKRFLAMYLSAGIIAGAVQVFISHGAVLGASGATMAVTAAFAAMYPNVRLMLIFPPIPVKAKYLAIAIIAMDAFSGFTGVSDGIGHFAHLAGAAMGFLLVLYWGKLNLR